VQLSAVGQCEGLEGVQQIAEELGLFLVLDQFRRFGSQPVKGCKGEPYLLAVDEGKGRDGFAVGHGLWWWLVVGGCY